MDHERFEVSAVRGRLYRQKWPRTHRQTALPLPGVHLLNHARPPISPEQVHLVDRLLSERISHRGICRMVRVSRTWFRHHLQSLVQTVPHRIDPQKVVSSKR